MMEEERRVAWKHWKEITAIKDNFERVGVDRTKRGQRSLSSMHENTFLIGGNALKRRRERQRKRGGRAKRRGNTKIYNLAWLWSTGRGYDHFRRVVLNNAFVTLRRVEWQPRIRNVPNKRVQKS